MPKPIMLVPVDFAGCAWDVVAFVETFAAKLDSAVVLLYCVKLPSGVDAHAVVHPDGLDVGVEAWLDADAREHLGPMLSTLQDAGLQASIELRHGDPVPTILAAVQAHGADHLVMGTHGRKGFRRLMEGSVAEQVLRRAPCPVTIVRTLAEATHPGPSPVMEQASAEADG